MDTLDNLKQAGDKAEKSDKARQEAINRMAEIINRNDRLVSQRLKLEKGRN